MVKKYKGDEGEGEEGEGEEGEVSHSEQDTKKYQKRFHKRREVVQSSRYTFLVAFQRVTRGDEEEKKRRKK